jgi:WD40 repeat protein
MKCIVVQSARCYNITTPVRRADIATDRDSEESMRRWFLSYNSEDLGLAQGLVTALEKKEPEARIFLAPKALRAGGYWMRSLAEEIAEATVFVLLIGENGISRWQFYEYCEAFDKHVKAADFSLVVLLLEGQTAPGLPFLGQLHWIITQDPTSEQTLARLMDAAAGAGTRPGQLWRHTAPYRGLAAMTEADTEYFFGRSGESIEVLRALETTPDRFAVLLGNSGVGKSSLAQAGVLASLKRQAWPAAGGAAGAWPAVFQQSRRWCFLRFNPGTEPLKALVESFLRTWQFETTDALWENRRTKWVEVLLREKATLRGLLDATERRYEELGLSKPPAFFLYVDQGEELYLRAQEHQGRRFSELLGDGVRDSRLRTLMSLRSDFFGDMQNDEPLYAVHHQINVPPLREAELREVVSRPAEILSARFETVSLANDIALRAAEESAKDAGTLPLLSYQLDDMWTQMVRRGDGVLRAQALELGRVLASRADAFLASHSEVESQVRRLLTLKLATVREDSEPTRRRALRSEFSDEEWRLVSELADHPHRLLITATPEGGGETYAEVAHEAIFRRWEALRAWIADEREFLIWKSGLEADRRSWQAEPEGSRDDALLRGLALAKAQDRLAKRADDLSGLERAFIEESGKAEAARVKRVRQQLETIAAEQRARARFQRRSGWALGAVAVLLLSGVVGVLVQARETAKREINVMTSVAQRAIEEGYHDRAMRVALHGLPPPGSLRFLAPWSDALEAKLAGAALLSRLQARLVGHQGWVMCVRFSTDGTRMVTCSEDGTARVWDVATGRQIGVLIGHQGSVRKAVFSPDSTRVVTAGSDGTARLWDAENGKEIVTLEGHKGNVWDAAFSPDGSRVATISEDHTGRIWNAATGQEIAVLMGHDDDLNNDVEFSPDGGRVVTASDDNTARVWDAATGQEIVTLKGHERPVWHAVFSPDGARIATASADQTARIWNAATGQEIVLLKGHQHVVMRARFSPDGTQVVTSGGDGTARLWDAETGREVAALTGHHGVVRNVAFSPNGRQVVTTSDERPVRVWDTYTGRQIAALIGHDDNGKDAKFSPDGLRIASGGADGVARLWNWIAGMEIAHHKRAIAFSPDGSQVLTVAKDRSAEVLDSATGRKICLIKHSGGAVELAIFNPDGTRLVTASPDAPRLWDPGNCREVAILEGHDGPVLRAAFSPDGRHVVTASEDGTARVWDSAAGRDLAVLAGHGGQVHLAAFSPDGTQVLTASGGTVRVWDWTSETQIAALTGSSFEGGVNSASFSPDGKRVATAWNWGIVRIWDARTGRELAVLRGHQGWAIVAVFSPDGRRVLTAGQDNARLWDAETGREVAALTAHLTWLQSGSFSPDGTRVLTGSGDGTARLWDTETGHEIAALKSDGRIVRRASFSADGSRVLTVSDDQTARIWDVSWATQVRGQLLRDRVCREKLVGAQEFTLLDAADPVLGGLEGTNPCLRRGPLSREYWERLPGDLWNWTRAKIAGRPLR